ncbi:MAG TPA: serine protease [Elusimicrobiales bacterium]|nr:serine protease [Elusimicrobiales bacterium]
MKNKLVVFTFLACAVSAGLLLFPDGRPGDVPGDLRDAPADFGYFDRADIEDMDVPVPAAAQAEPVRSGYQPVAIYGDNTLDDYYKVDKSLQELADSVVALMDKSAIAYDEASGAYKPLKLSTVDRRMGLSSGAEFSGQKSLSFCSGALVSRDLVLTAGHCINNDPSHAHYFNKVYVVFGWRQTGRGEYDQTFSPDQVYEVERLLAHKLDGSIGNMDTYRDYALISLKRPVPGRSPLTIERSHGEGLREGAYVFASGYPMGMSVKVTDPGDATIREIGRNGYATDLDAFGGSSGGPVFDSVSRRICGVVITANAKQFKYTVRREFSLRYREDADPSATLDLVREEGGKVLVVPQGDLEAVTNSLRSVGCGITAERGGGLITFPLGYSFYNNQESLLNDLISLTGTERDVYGEPVQLPAYEGIGTGVQKISVELEVFTPFTAEENRMCERIRSRMRNGMTIDPAFMQLYKDAKCDSRRMI